MMSFLNSKMPIAVLVLAPLALTSCEFGNKSTTSLTGYDVISGYYASLPQTIKFQAQIGTGAARDVVGTVNQIPDFLKALMGNPAMLYYDNPLTQEASIRSHSDTSLGVTTKVQERTSTFGASDSAYAISAGCRVQQDTVNTGTFKQGLTTQTIAGLTVRGTLSFDYQITTTLIGDDVDCDAMRATFKSCYIDNVGCSTSNTSIFYRAFIVNVFGPLINAGVMTDVEIGSARSVSYHATYQ